MAAKSDKTTIRGNIGETIYNKVHLTPLFNPNKGEDRPITYIDNPDDIINTKCKFGCEYVGINNKVKPYFDVDYRIPYDTAEEEIMKLRREKDIECLNIIKEWFDDYDVTICKSFKKWRPCMVKTDANTSKLYYKISLRYFVNGVVMKNYNIMKFLNNKDVSYEKDHDKPFDLGIYNKGRVLLLPYTNKPKCEKDETETVLYPVRNNDGTFNVFDYCSTYIKETDEDLDVLFNDDINDADTDYNIADNTSNDADNTSDVLEKLEDCIFINDNTDEIMGSVKKYVKGLNEKVSDDYNQWVKVGYALRSVAEKYDTKKKCLKLFKVFSKKSSKYDEDETTKLFNNIKLKTKSVGLPTLKKMYELCIYGDDLEKKSYENVKVQFEKNICKVLKGSVFVYKDIYGDYQYINKDKLNTNYQNKKCYMKDDEGFYRTVDFLKIWLNDENIRTYDKIDCDPSGTEKGVFNIWCGFKAESLTKVEDDKIEDLIKPILHHLEEVVTGEKDLWFLLSWFANIIQNPHKKTDVAILIRGLQGTGKDIILVWFMSKILGHKCSSQNASLSELFDRFDNTCVNNVFSIIDEVNIKDLVGEKGGNADKFKNLITSETVRFEEKGIMKTTLKNYINIIMTSNGENPIIIPHDDRRFVVFDTKTTYKSNTSYFKALGDHLKRDDVARAFYQYLMKYDISNIDNFQDIRPITSYYNELKRLNLPVFYRYLSYLCENSHTFVNEDDEEDVLYSVSASSLYTKYVDWIKSRNYTYTSNSTLFGRDLKKITDVDINIINKRRARAGVEYVIDLIRLKTYLISISLYDSEIV